jgi:glutamyl/glutaminyl-tRNA synthetase
MTLSKNKIKFKLILSLITLLTIFCFSISAFSAETASIDEQIEQLRSIIDSSSYSAFQSSMILNTAQELLESGIPFEDTKKIIENSIEESFDAYNVKKVFDIILETQQEGLPAEPLINKVNEGFAKNVNNSVLISVISTKAENLKKANEILNKALQEGLEINGEEEIVKILADSLENDVPQESLSWLLKTGTVEGSSIEEIIEISEELSYLSLLAYDSGLSSEEISLLFQKATENSSNIEEICENLQNSLEAEISTAKIEGGGTAKPSTTSDSGTLPTSSTGSQVEVGETPSQEAGEAPTETGSTPEPSTSPTQEAPSPPEN